MSKLESQVNIYTDCKYDLELIKQHINDSKVLEVIKKGDRVLIKPNFVQEKNERKDTWEEMITNPVVITATLELILDILERDGEIVIADAPMTPAKWDAIMKHMPVDHWRLLCETRGVKLSIIDLRDEEWDNAPNGIILKKKMLRGDPAGKVICNLQNQNSEFYGKIPGKHGYYGANYNQDETNKAHNGVDNIYSVSKTVISCDVLINIPKLKTHKKAGITCALKNLVGINTNKNLLPHHTNGTPSEGGDQFESSSNDRVVEEKVTYYAKRIVQKFRFLTPLLVPLKNVGIRVWGNNMQAVKSGGWYGNDTLWRTIIDLNKVMYYANQDGSLRDDDLNSRKRYVAIVDGIIAGEGMGPLAPDPVDAGWLLCGNNPVTIDCTVAKLMGFNYENIPQIFNSLRVNNYKIANCEYDDIKCMVDGEEYRIRELPYKYVKCFNAAMGWIGHIEENYNVEVYKGQMNA